MNRKQRRKGRGQRPQPEPETISAEPIRMACVELAGWLGFRELSRPQGNIGGTAAAWMAWAQAAPEFDVLLTLGFLAGRAVQAAQPPVPQAPRLYGANGQALA